MIKSILAAAALVIGLSATPGFAATKAAPKTVSHHHHSKHHSHHHKHHSHHHHHSMAKHPAAKKTDKKA